MPSGSSRRRYLPWLAVLLTGFSLGAATRWITARTAPDPTLLDLTTWRWASGDRVEWAQPTFDDSAWPEIHLRATPDPSPISWLRARPQLDSVRLPIGLQVSALATCQAYWDGGLLPGEGRVGVAPETEAPGPLVQLLHVPDRLAGLGPHTLALRCSAHHRGFRSTAGFWSVAVGEYGVLTLQGASHTWPAALSLSAMLIVGAFYVVLYFADPKDRSALLIGLLALCGAALLVTEAWRSLVPYTYDWHLTRLVVVTALGWSLSLLLALFFVVRFPLGWPRWFLLAVAGVATLPLFVYQGWDPKAAMMFYGAGLLVLGRGLAAVYRDHEGSALASTGVASLLAVGLARPEMFLDQTLFLGLDVLLMCLLASHALQVRQTRRDREAAQLKSARLEIELLKKHIQPHFLMNTLTALAEWFEEEPDVATDLIQALAEEFRVLTEISSRCLVPVRDELRLCRSHLEIMSRRKGKQYRLDDEGVEGHRLLPPAVLHTLIENAITHDDHDQPEVSFRLQQHPMGSRVHYRLEAPIGASDRESGEEGTGLRYVRARLEEAFGSAWSFTHGRHRDRWRSEISVPAQLGGSSG